MGNKRMVILEVCLFVINVFCATAAAHGGGCPPLPPCPGPCRSRVDGVCVYICYCCDGKACYDPETAGCCNEGTGKTCPKDKECCNGDCCNRSQCKYCVYNYGPQYCESRCDPDQCEECDGNGHCKVCSDDPYKICCNGECCSDPAPYCESGRCVECRMNFDCDECEECVNGSCVAKTCPPYQYCLLDGSRGCCCGSEVCSWEMLGIESTCPASGIPNDPYCGAGTVGAVCWWEVETLNTATHIGSCSKLYYGKCVKLTPRLCQNECTPFYPIFCICSETSKGSPILLGDSERCIGW